MSQRPGYTKWLWCLFAVYVGPGWSRAVSVRTPPKNPTTIEAQAKFFQDFFSVQLSPYNIEFGHVCEDPNTWEQRYEKKDFKNHRDMGKVRWGDKHGGYGEHYWDLNHAGHAGNHGNDGYDNGSDDDGSYNHDLDHAHDDHDAYDEPSEQVPTYGTEEYDPEQAAKYDESGRAKRAHPRIKTERKIVRAEENDEEQPKQKSHQKIKERLQAAPTTQEFKVKEVEYTTEPSKRKRRQRRPENDQKDKKAEKQTDVDQKEEQKKEPQYYVQNKNEEQSKQENQPQYYVKEKNEEQNHQEQQPQYYVKNKHEEQSQYEQQPQYYVKNKNEQQNQQEQQPQYYVKNRNEEQSQYERQPQYYVKNKNEEHSPQEQQPQYYVKRTENQFVPYEQGAGVRQHQHPELTPAASAPRLFLEPTTGHVVDRATGQAYVLQPIAVNNYN